MTVSTMFVPDVKTRAGEKRSERRDQTGSWSRRTHESEPITGFDWALAPMGIQASRNARFGSRLVIRFRTSDIASLDTPAKPRYESEGIPFEFSHIGVGQTSAGR